jgi:hypothetical protein
MRHLRCAQTHDRWKAYFPEYPFKELFEMPLDMIATPLSASPLAGECTREWSKKVTRKLSSVATTMTVVGLLGLTGIHIAQAQTAPKSTRIRGEIVSLSGDNLVVHRNSGGTVTIVLAADAKVGAFKRMKLSDIEAGSYIGTAAMTGVDGKMTATEVHVFPPEARGTGDGHRPFDLGPKSTMTNGNVDSVLKGRTGNVLQISYKGGVSDVTVPPNVPVVGFILATRADLSAGKKVLVTATQAADEAYSSKQVMVEKDGVAPPM